MTGESEDAIEKRLRSGYWLKDVHARVPEGARERWINLDAVDDWAAGAAPAHQHGKRVAA